MTLAVHASHCTRPVLEALMKKVDKEDLLATNEFENGNTILHYAAMNNNVQMVQYLITHPPARRFVWRKDNDGHSAIVLAAERGLVAVLQTFLSNGIRFVFRTHFLLKKAIRGCSYSGSVEHLKVLLNSEYPLSANFKQLHDYVDDDDDLDIDNPGLESRIHELIHVAKSKWLHYTHQTKHVLLNQTPLIEPIITIIQKLVSKHHI